MISMMHRLWASIHAEISKHCIKVSRAPIKLVIIWHVKNFKVKVNVWTIIATCLFVWLYICQSLTVETIQHWDIWILYQLAFFAKNYWPLWVQVSLRCLQDANLEIKNLIKHTVSLCSRHIASYVDKIVTESIKNEESKVNTFLQEWWIIDHSNSQVNYTCSVAVTYYLQSYHPC